MDAADFELNVQVPADARYAGALRDLAAHAARYAGSPEQCADRYGDAVKRVALACLNRTDHGAEVPVIVRRGAGPLEFLIGCGSRFEAPSGDGPITIGWTRVQGAAMCCIALEL